MAKRSFGVMALVRFYWDFAGPDAAVTAAHFAQHVEEFCARENISGHQLWTSGDALRYTATLECEEGYLPLVRDALRPVRAGRVG
jgi:hypothetical protein